MSLAAHCRKSLGLARTRHLGAKSQFLLVSNAIVLPLSGWLSSIVGRKRFYMGCVALFTISSFMVWTGPTWPSLLSAAFLQGAGGGGLQPSEHLFWQPHFRRPARYGVCVYGIAVVTAPAIGPRSAVDYENLSWRWFSSSNIPVGILLSCSLPGLFKTPPIFGGANSAKPGLIRRLGFVALGLGALQIVLDKGQRTTVRIALHPYSCHRRCGILIFVGFWSEAQDPVIDLHLFRDRTFGVSNLLMFMLDLRAGSTLLLPYSCRRCWDIRRSSLVSRSCPAIHHHAACAAGGFLLSRTVRAGC